MTAPIVMRLCNRWCAVDSWHQGSSPGWHLVIQRRARVPVIHSKYVRKDRAVHPSASPASQVSMARPLPTYEIKASMR